MKKYLIIDQENHNVDYVVEQDDDKFTLKRSKARFWENPNEELLTLEDTGNDLKLSNGLKLDYSEFEQLVIILQVYKSTQRMPTNYLSTEL